MTVATQSTVILDDGATTTLEQWGTSGPLVVCVHGMTSSRKAWVRLAQRLSATHRVFAYDQRGHGNSASLHGPMSLERGVRDLENVAATLGRVDMLIGHSWGGAVAIRGGDRLPVRGIVAIDPMIVQVGKPWYDEYVAELDDLFAVSGHERDQRVREEFHDWDALDVEGKIHAVHAMTSEPIAALYTDNAEGTWDLRREIAGYSKPLLLLMAGRDSSIVPTRVVDEVRANHPADTRIVSFEDQGHNLHRTAFDRAALEIERFLVSL